MFVENTDTEISCPIEHGELNMLNLWTHLSSTQEEARTVNKPQSLPDISSSE